MYKCFRPGDIVVAKVVSLWFTESEIIFLSFYCINWNFSKDLIFGLLARVFSSLKLWLYILLGYIELKKRNFLNHLNKISNFQLTCKILLSLKFLIIQYILCILDSDVTCNTCTTGFYCDKLFEWCNLWMKRQGKM